MRLRHKPVGTAARTCNTFPLDRRPRHRGDGVVDHPCCDCVRVTTRTRAAMFRSIRAPRGTRDEASRGGFDMTRGSRDITGSLPRRALMRGVTLGSIAAYLGD